MPFDLSDAHALALDAADPLRSFRDRFYLADSANYLDGSLTILRRQFQEGNLSHFA